MKKELSEAKSFLLNRCGAFPDLVITLGSGLGYLLNEMKIEMEVLFSEIPHFKKATVVGHQGKLLIGNIGKRKVACLQGRLHYYEGYSMQDVVFPFRTLASCGAGTFLLTNAAGGVRSDMKAGDLMVITDHLNLMGDSPLMGENEPMLGERFPDMSEVYDKSLRASLIKTASRLSIPLHEGVYAGLHGPSYETPAEVRMLRVLGADAIGMSTVPEAIALNHMGKKIVGISCITNLAAGIYKGQLKHEEVLEVGKAVQARFSLLVKEYIHAIP